MGSSVTLAQLKARARQRADQVNSGFVQDDELATYINISAKKLYDLLIAAYGEDYYIADPFIITADGTNDTYDLPDDYYKMLGVDEDKGGGSFFTLKPFMFQERNQYREPYFAYSNFIASFKYKIQGNQIKFIPIPPANSIFKLWYSPVMTNLTNDTDQFDGVNGWEEFIVLDAAIKMMLKEESDVNVLQVERKIIEDNLIAMASNRDSGMALRVQDVRKDQFSPNGWGRGLWEY